MIAYLWRSVASSLVSLATVSLFLPRVISADIGFTRVSALPAQCRAQCTLQMLDVKNGWLFGDRFLWKTRDGGTHWMQAPFPDLEAADFGRGRFVSERDGWLLSNSQHIYETSTGGMEWMSETPPMLDGIVEAFWASFDFDRIWLGGGEYRPSDGPNGPNHALRRNDFGRWDVMKPVIFRRDDVNTHWVKQTLPDCGFIIFELKFWNEKRGVAAGDNGCFYLTENAGDRWISGRFHGGTDQAQDDDGLPTFYFINPDKGWLSTRSSLYITSDGGRNWSPISVRGTPHFDALAFSDSSWGWGIARQSEIYASTNGGRKWKRLKTDFVPRSLCFLNSHTGWILSDSTLYRIRWSGV